VAKGFALGSRSLMRLEVRSSAANAFLSAAGIQPCDPHERTCTSQGLIGFATLHTKIDGSQPKAA